MDLQRLKGEIVAVYGTQLEFSKAIGWHKNKVSKMVCGKYKPEYRRSSGYCISITFKQNNSIGIFFCQIYHQTVIKVHLQLKTQHSKSLRKEAG